MNGLGHSLFAGVPPHLRVPVCDCSNRSIPVPVAAMRLLTEAKQEGEAQEALRHAIRELDGCDPASASRLLEVIGLIDEHPGAWRIVRNIHAHAEHAGSAVRAGGETVRWAETFDRAAEVSPEAGVALYSLGSPALLQRATTEVVEWMQERHLIGRNRCVLDIGCGIGRFEEALAPKVARITALDISRQMLAIASERCRALPNVLLVLSSGLSLSMVKSHAVDLVLAVDVFPYLVLAGTDLARLHVEEAARVLRPRGSLLILNFSYRGDADADRMDLLTAAASAELEVIVAGIRPFKSWDGAVYLLKDAR